MHFEILVEDQSGKKTLEILVPKIVGPSHTFKIHFYKGIGSIPKNMRAKSDPEKRILLNQLPKFLRGYGETFRGYGSEYQAVLFVICDLDDRCLKKFRQELLGVLSSCDPRPETRFCIAIEEGEAWFLGDPDAVLSAFSYARRRILSDYESDSICGTWEKLADAVYPGGAPALSRKGWKAIGAEKARWAEMIAPYVDFERNKSPSFQYFLAKMREMCVK